MGWGQSEEDVLLLHILTVGKGSGPSSRSAGSTGTCQLDVTLTKRAESWIYTQCTATLDQLTIERMNIDHLAAEPCSAESGTLDPATHPEPLRDRVIRVASSDPSLTKHNMVQPARQPGPPISWYQTTQEPRLTSRGRPWICIFQPHPTAEGKFEK